MWNAVTTTAGAAGDETAPPMPGMARAATTWVPEVAKPIPMLASVSPTMPGRTRVAPADVGGRSPPGVEARECDVEVVTHAVAPRGTLDTSSTTTGCSRRAIERIGRSVA